MKQTHLIELILTLSVEDQKHILDFAKIDYFAKGRYKSFIHPLLEICFGINWEDENNKPSKEEIYRAVFSETEIVDGKLEKLLVDALRLVRTYLLIKRYLREENEFFQVYDFAEISRKLQLDSRHKSYLNRLHKLQEGEKVKNHNFYYRQLLLDHAIHDFESLNNHVRGDLHAPSTVFSLGLHYHSIFLGLASRFLVQKKVAVVNVPPFFEEQLSLYQVPQEFLDESAFILIFSKIFDLLQKPRVEPTDAHHLFDLIQSHEKELDEPALVEFYTHLRNICILTLNAHPDDDEMYNLLFKLYKDNLNRGYFHYEGKLHPSRYLAISEYAARMNKYDWAFEFIEKYKDQIIGETETQDVYRLNLAMYYFGIGKFQDCLDNIPGSLSYVDYQITAKRLEIKALFELKSSLLDYKLDAFKMYLSRTSPKLLSPPRRQMNLDFANFMQQIMSAPPSDAKRIQRIINRIEEQKHTAERRWLLEKIKSLK